MTAHHHTEPLLRPGNDYENYTNNSVCIFKKNITFILHRYCVITLAIFDDDFFVNRTLKMEKLYIF